MMKSYRLILTLLVLTFLSGCQKNDQPKPDTSANNTVLGPSDSGGGDTCNGKAIESYRVDVTALPEYRQYIQPIFKTIETDPLATKSPTPLDFSAKMKNWYMVDCKLQSIPASKKGLYLETHQTAIHTSREVFIDSSSYSLMSQEEKAKLLLHEIVMGHYLLKYLSIEQICKNSKSCDPKFEKISAWKLFRPETYRALNDEDHQKIRNVTAWLWTQKENLDVGKFLNILNNNDFDKRFPMVSDLNTHLNKEVQLEPEALVRMFKKYQWTNSFPQFCNFETRTNTSESVCSTEVTSEIRPVDFSDSASPRHLFIKIKFTRETDKKVFEQNFSYPLLGDHPKITLYMSKIGGVLNVAPLAFYANWPQAIDTKSTEGLKSQLLFIFFNVSNIRNPEIYQIYYQTYVWYSFEEVLVEKNGVTYKETYGYPSILTKESEILFIENELPFNFAGSFLTDKMLLSSTPITPN